MIRIGFVFFVFGYSLIVSCDSTDNSKSSDVKRSEDVEDSEDDFGETECVPNEKFVSGKSGFFETRAVIRIFSFSDTTYSESPCEIVNGKFKTINSIDSITLNDNQKKQLEKLLYGSRTKHFGNVSEASGCYNPRHAIVYAGSQEVVAFQEICFECNGQRYEGNGPGIIDFCDEKWDELQEFFKSVGITYFGPNQK